MNLYFCRPGFGNPRTNQVTAPLPRPPDYWPFFWETGSPSDPPESVYPENLSATAEASGAREAHTRYSELSRTQREKGRPPGEQGQWGVWIPTRCSSYRLKYMKGLKLNLVLLAPRAGAGKQLEEGMFSVDCPCHYPEDGHEGEQRT